MRVGLFLIALTMGVTANPEPVSATSLVTNGSFANGLSGWQAFRAAGIGSVSTGSFDVDGKGGAETAAVISGVAGSSIFSATGTTGITQVFTVSSAGTYNFTAAIADMSSYIGMTGGTVSVLLNNVVMDSYTFSTAGLTSLIQRSTLDFSTALSTGSYTMSIEVTRNAFVTSPAFYVSDVSFVSAAAQVSPVPEPATWLTMIGGFGMIGLALRRTRNRPRFAEAQPLQREQ